MATTDYQLDAIDAVVAREIERIQDWVDLVAPIGGGVTRRVAVDPDQNAPAKTIELDDGTIETRLSTTWFDRFKGDNGDYSEYGSSGETFTQALAYTLVDQAMCVRLYQIGADEDENLWVQAARVFGPGFTEDDIYEATNRRYSPEARANRTSNTNVDSIVGAVEGQLFADARDGFSGVLNVAWHAYLTHKWRPHLARELGGIAERRYLEAFPDVVKVLEGEAAKRASEALKQILTGTYVMPQGAQRATAPRRNALDRMKELAEDPSRLEESATEDDAELNLKKAELFEIMQLLSNVVNEDVDRFIEDGEDIHDGKLLALAPFRADSSSLASQRWAGAVARAAYLIKQIPSATHKAAMKYNAPAPGQTGSDIDIVLFDIEGGYEVSNDEDRTIEAAELVILAANPFTSPDELREAIANSSSLTVQKAGINPNALKGARFALSLPIAEEGSYAPPNEAVVDPENLVYNERRRRVRYRKPLGEFEIPKSCVSYAMAIDDIGPTEQEPTVNDIVIDDMGATLTMACPALTPMSREELAPVPAHWQRRVDRTYHGRWLKYLPERAFSVIPDDLRAVVKFDQDIAGVEVHDIPGVRVVVRCVEGYMSISGDDAALAGVHFERDDNGVLRVTGSGESGAEIPENPDEWPELEIRLRGGQGHFDFDGSGVEHLSLYGADKARVTMPDDSYLFIGALDGKLDLGERTSVVVAPVSRSAGGEMDMLLPDVKAGRDLPSITVFGSDTSYAPQVRGAEYAGVKYPLADDELPRDVRDQLDRGADWIAHDVLNVENGRDVLRNKCVSAITRESRSNATFLAGLMAASEDRTISPNSRRVFQSMVRIVTSDEDIDQPTHDKLREEVGAAGRTFFEDLGRVTTTNFDTPRAMATHLDQEEMQRVAPLLKLNERRAERTPVARARRVEPQVRHAGHAPAPDTPMPETPAAGAPEPAGRKVEGRPGPSAKRGAPERVTSLPRLVPRSTEVDRAEPQPLDRTRTQSREAPGL